MFDPVETWLNCCSAAFINIRIMVWLLKKGAEHSNKLRTHLARSLAKIATSAAACLSLPIPNHVDDNSSQLFACVCIDRPSQEEPNT